jgi:4-hydroxybenzoate polyprenyltransferase
MESGSRESLQVDELKWGRAADWLQLIRLPNVFTVLSNCIAAAIISVGELGRLNSVLPLFLASVLAYWAGLIYNDVNDLEEDRQHRPDRPLAAGRISPVLAGHVATGLLIISTVIVMLSARHIDTKTALTGVSNDWKLWQWSAIGCSIGLGVAIRLYNTSLKQTFLGPLLMGLCRSLNILMIGYAMLCIYWGQPFSAVERFPNSLLAYAVGIGVYICGLTIYARREEQTSSPATLVLGTLLEIVGLVVIASVSMFTFSRPLQSTTPPQAVSVLIGLIGFTIASRAISGILHPVPRRVQLAVKNAILSIIMIDAAVVLMFAGTAHAIGVVLLLLPALLSAVRVRTT